MKYYLNRKEVLEVQKEVLKANEYEIFKNFINETNFTENVYAGHKDWDLEEIIERFYDKVYDSLFNLIENQIKTKYTDEEEVDDAYCELVQREGALIYNTAVRFSNKYTKDLVHIFNTLNNTNFEAKDFK